MSKVFTTILSPGTFTKIAILFASAFNLNAQNDKPNIVIFIADDVSWNDFGCYGNKVVQTPNTDRISSEGVKFTNVYLTASSCSPSRNSIMTGRYPHNTGAAELHTSPPIEMIAFPELLKDDNYYCVQAGKYHMGDNARRGFHKINENKNTNGDGGEELWVQSLRERPLDKPFFMWFASYDAHRPWGSNSFSESHKANSISPPLFLANEPGTKADLAKYYDEIKRFDYYIGEVEKELQKQAVLDNTIIIIMADNGRPFPRSKTRVYDSGMKTPFIVKWTKGIKEIGSVCNSLISVIDIAPTLLNLAGVPAIQSIQGYDFSDLLKDPNLEFRDYIYAEHNWHDYEAHERMLRTKEYMYILNSRPEFANQGPADAVRSPSFIELLELKDKGNLTPAQYDIFLSPRPVEELFKYNDDSQQLTNIASNPNYNSVLLNLRKNLIQWMEETDDDVPNKLTEDWFERETGLVIKEKKGIRGQMPGAKTKAVKNNSKAAF